MSAVERGKSASVEALIQEVLRSVKEFTEGEAFPDDVTLLALQFKGLNATNEGGHTIAPREKK